MATIPSASTSQVSYRVYDTNGMVAGTSISTNNDMGKLWLQ